MPTTQYLARSARLMIAHSGHLNVEMQAAVRDTKRLSETETTFSGTRSQNS